MTSDSVERTAGGAVLLDGNRLRDETVSRLRSEIEAAGSPEVCLATVLVGADKPSQIYVRMKHRKAEEAGLVSRGVELPESATQAEVEEQVAALVADPTVHGILVQLLCQRILTRSRFSHCCHRRRMSTGSPSAHSVASFVTCPGMCPARRSVSCA